MLIIKMLQVGQNLSRAVTKPFCGNGYVFVHSGYLLQATKRLRLFFEKVIFKVPPHLQGPKVFSLSMVSIKESFNSSPIFFWFSLNLPNNFTKTPSASFKICSLVCFFSRMFSI